MQVSTCAENSVSFKVCSEILVLSMISAAFKLPPNFYIYLEFSAHLKTCFSQGAK